ncbi:hypothetical protein JM47_02265 [Ureaplasma diversum]|uniref:Uncharacterized protein n=1 Tax=Ureaplasma diversum TaxID=42094 RepID=A0A0C5RPV2_9BACT|nr:hypothetical protein [Ureaplasma diversum]AJQ45394.1 hypothetical protein JM47_02265 [Ureaplasma diversum]
MSEFKNYPSCFKEYTIIFNVYGEPINEHPVVIWYNEYEGMYYFVKARSATKSGIKIPPFETETLIPAILTSKKVLFYEDSLVDCSQIFRMNKYEFEILYGNNDPLDVELLPYPYVIKIIDKIEKNLEKRHLINGCKN